MDSFGEDGIQDFFSQMDPYSPADGFDFCSDEVGHHPLSSSIHGPWMGIEALTLISKTEGEPHMAAY
jgi:hypothetical protein